MTLAWVQIAWLALVVGAILFAVLRKYIGRKGKS